jgi:hypothetical protein
MVQDHSASRDHEVLATLTQAERRQLEHSVDALIAACPAPLSATQLAQAVAAYEQWAGSLPEEQGAVAGLVAAVLRTRVQPLPPPV